MLTLLQFIMRVGAECCCWYETVSRV